MIMKCVCKNAYQDQIHGESMRVFNVVPAEPKGSKGRCSVCGVEKTKSGGAEEKKTKSKSK